MLSRMERPWFLRWKSLRAVGRGGYRYLFGKRGQRRVASFRLYYRLRLMMPLFSRHAARGLARLPGAKLWMDREVFPRIFAWIQRARHTVVVQTFIWKDDAVGRALAAALVGAADRGVQVFVHKEAVGDVFETAHDFLSTRERKDGVWRRFWNHPRIRIAHETHHDHAKVFVIDDRTLLVTGMNVACEYHEDWHDFMVELRGTHFVEQYVARGEIPSATGSVRLVMNSERRREVRPAVMGLLEGARRSVVLEQCYLSDPDVVRALARRSREGISVTVIIPSDIDVHYHSNMDAVGRLLREGSPAHLRVFVYPGVFHAKVLLVDRHCAFLGSANLVTSSLDDMGEVNVLIASRLSQALQRLRDVLRADLLKSRPLRGAPPFLWFHRLLAWVNL